MTSEYRIDAGQWPQVLSDNWVRLRGQFDETDSVARWIMQIEALLRGPVKSEDIMHGIQWALVHVQSDSFFTPGPKDIVGWIRRYRDEQRQEQDVIVENGKDYIKLTDKQRAEAKAAFRDCIKSLSAKQQRG